MKKRILSAILTLCILAAMTPFSFAASPEGDIEERLQQISSTSPYQNASYTAFNGQGLGSGCYAFINAVSRQLFGVGIPSQVSATSLDANSNWTCVGTAGADNSAARSLLAQAQAGDIFQYKNSYTKPYHIAMVYSTSRTDIVIYDNTSSTGARIRSYSLSSLSGLGDFSAAGSGISLYRCTRNVLTTPVGSSAETAVQVTVTTGAAEDLTENSATLHGSVQSSIAVSEVGMYLGESRTAMTKLGSDAVSGRAPNMWYNTTKYGRTLVSGRIYFYQAYAVVNGQTYWGEIKTFMPYLVLNDDLRFADSSAYDLPAMFVGKPIQPIDVSGGVTGGTKPYTFSASRLPAGIEISSDGVISGTPLFVAIAEPATITVRDAAGNSRRITIDCAEVSVAEPDFSLEIDYQSETIAVQTGLQWTEDADRQNGIITAMWDEELPIGEPGEASYFLYFGNTLYFRDSNNESADWTKVEIPSRPAAPRGVSGGKGEITGVSRAMEYSADGENWTACSGGTVSGLAAGSYRVRYQAETDAFASEPVTVRVAAAAIPADWQERYREVVAEQYDSELGGDAFSTYRLFDVNDDGLPELFVFGTNEAQGDQVYTVRSNGAVTQLAISQGDFMYDADRQLLWIPHGHMGGYYDDIYRLENGSFIREHTGRYGAAGGDWQTIDFYEWDGERVSQSAYETYLAAAVDTDGAVNLTRGGISAQEVLKQLGADVEEPSDSGFSDVPAGAWFADAVEYVSQNGMMNGTSSNRFSPNDSTNRAMIATILYRLEGEPDISRENLGYPFADVDADAYYGMPVYWARLNGVVNGVSSTQFAPNDAITREQLAAILYRYAGYKGYDTSTGGMSLAAYTDANRISSYALTAMRWANGEGLITGKTSTTLDPKGTATRAEVATILMRFCEDVVK